MTDQPTLITPRPVTDVSKAQVIEAARAHAASLHPTGGAYYASPRSIAEIEALKAGERAGFTEGVSWLFDLIFGAPLAPHEVARAERAAAAKRESADYSESVDTRYGAWDTDALEEHAHDLAAVVRHRRGETVPEAEQVRPYSAGTDAEHRALTTNELAAHVAEILAVVRIRRAEGRA